MTTAAPRSLPARYPVGCVDISEVTLESAARLLLDAPLRGDRLSVHFVTAHTIVEASRDPELRSKLARGDLLTPDGMPLVWAGRLLGKRVSRVYGPDVLPLLVDRGRAVGARHYFYGAAPGVPERLADELHKRFPGVLVVGMESPPFRSLSIYEDAAVVERINRARPDFVWVGLGSPKQDLWIADHRERLEAAALLGVGAAFNIHAGELRQAPAWMQRAGLEWLFRLLMEPRRLWRRYTVVNAVFLSLLARQGLRAFVSKLRRAI